MALMEGNCDVGNTRAMRDSFFYSANFFKRRIEKKLSVGIGVIPCHLFMFGNFLSFFL
jgi:hypothetical protein